MLDHIRNENDGELPVSASASDRVSQGIPVTDQAEMCIEFGDVDRYIHGIPYTANGLIACSTGTVTHVSNGIAYDTDGKVVLGADGLEVEARYVFDGTTMYATIPDWSPLGLPFTVSVEAVPLTVDNTARYLVASNPTSGQGVYLAGGATGVAGELSFRYKDTGGTTRLPTVSPLVVGSGFSAIGEGNASEGKLTALGSSDTDPAPTLNLTPLSRIAATGNGTSLWHGPIYNLRLTDNSPIQSTTACMGDSNRYVQIDEPIVLEGDFEIAFDWIRQDTAAGTSIVELMGKADSTPVNTLGVYDSGQAAPNTFRMDIGGVGWTIADVFENVAQGQHCAVKAVRTLDSLEVYVDEELRGTRLVTIDPFTIDLLGLARTTQLSRSLPTNSALQNIKITDITNNREWLYTLDEGTGLVANNTGATQGNYLNLPMYDTTVLEGDGARYIEIPQFTIPAGDDFEIEWDGIRQDNGGNDSSIIIGNLDDPNTGRIRLYDSGASTPDRIQVFFVNSSRNDDVSFTDVAQGQHYRCKVSSTAAVGVVVTVDGVDGPINGIINEDFIVNAIGAANVGATMPIGASLQNVTLSNLTTGEYVQYRIDEGSGTTVKAYDKNGDEIPNALVFSNGNDITGWSVVTGVPDIRQNGEFMEVENTTADICNIRKTVDLVEGKTYRVDVTAGPVSTLGVAVTLGNLSASNVSANTSAQFEFVAVVTATAELQVSTNAATLGRIISFSVLDVTEVNAGTITPDASWAYIPPYSTDGAWTPDTDWTAIADNSRYYPMDPSTISATGELIEVLNGEDGQIENFDSDNLVSPF